MKKASRACCVLQICALMMACMAAPVLAAAPQAPSHLRVTAYTASAVSLNWNDHATNETAYHVVRTASGVEDSETVFDLEPSTISFTDTTVSPATMYVYHVYASNPDGSSGLSNTQTVTTRPPPPQAVKDLVAIAQSPSSIYLGWTPPADYVAGQSVYRKRPGESDFQKIAVIPETADNWIDQTCHTGTEYQYKISVQGDDTLSYWSSQASAVTPPAGTTVGPPEAPSGLQLSAEPSPFKVSLEWTDNASYEIKYYVERKTASQSEYKALLVSGPDLEIYLDEAVEQGETYNYRVWCWSTRGSSPYSNELTVEVPRAVPPPAPSDLRLVSSTSTEVALAWTDNGFNETGYVIERKDPGESGFQSCGTGGPDLEAYKDKTVKPGSSYKYRVYCSNIYGDSDPSAEISVTVPAVGTPPVFVATVISYYLNDSTFYVNGSARTMDVAPLAHQERILLPIRFVVEPLGGTAEWDAGEQMATVLFNDHVINLWVGSSTALVDGQEKMIDPSNQDVAPLIVDPGRTMMPLRFIAESTGCTVEWLDETSEARVSFDPGQERSI